MTPMKAIRAKCLDCCGGVCKMVRECTAPNCPLWPYRFGRRPKINFTPENPTISEEEATNPAEGYTDTPGAVRGVAGAVESRREEVQP